jgi:hypothetical protein
MNIFFTDTDPHKAAISLDDKRVVKMVLETCQMLSTAINENGGQAPYKSTHKNHPSNIWCRETRDNWTWLWLHGKALSEEYTFRYGKVHKCDDILKQLLEMRLNLPEGPLTTFANCAAHQGKGFNFKLTSPVTDAYRLYLNARWSTDARPPQWTGRKAPDWSDYA